MLNQFVSVPGYNIGLAGQNIIALPYTKYFSLKVKNIFTNIREFFSIFTYYLL